MAAAVKRGIFVVAGYGTGAGKLTPFALRFESCLNSAIRIVGTGSASA
jgi:hypothetical protein